MSSMDLTKDDFWTRYGTRQRTLHRPFHFKRVMQNTKSSSLMRLTTQPTMFNSFYGQILRRFITTADSSLPVITKTKSLNLFTPDVQSLILESKEKTNQNWQVVSFEDFNKSWIRKGFDTMKKFLRKSSTNIFPIGDVSSTNARGIRWGEKLTREFLHLSRTLQ